MNPVTVFVSYQRPLHCRKTLIEIVVTFAVCVLSFAVAVWSTLNSTEFPTLIEVSSAAVASVVSIVTFIIGCMLLFSFVTGRIHEVCITDQGIKYDGDFWPWTSVTSIRSTLHRSDGAVYLNVELKRHPLRSKLTLPVELQEKNRATSLEALRRYLEEAGYPIHWSDT